jgi:hypothetical protein
MEMLANFLHNSFDNPPESYKKVANVRAARVSYVESAFCTFVNDDLAENTLDMRVLPAKFEGGHFGHLRKYFRI